MRLAPTIFIILMVVSATRAAAPCESTLLGLKLRSSITQTRRTLPLMNVSPTNRFGETSAQILTDAVPSYVRLANLRFLDGRLYSVIVVFQKKGISTDSLAEWAETITCKTDVPEFGSDGEYDYASLVDGLAMGKLIRRQKFAGAPTAKPVTRESAGGEIKKPHGRKP